MNITDLRGRMPYEETAVRVNLETIEQLCELFEVKVVELFEHAPDGTAKKPARRSNT